MHKNIINFQDHKLYISKINCLLCPIHTSIVLFDYMFTNHNNFFYKQLEVLKIISFKKSLEICSLKKISISKKVDLFLIILNSFGFGNIKLIRINNLNDKFLFKCKNPIFSKMMHEIFRNNYVTDQFIAYLLSGFFEALKSKQTKFSISQKKDGTYYELNICDNSLDYSMNNIDNNNSNKSENKKLNSLLTRVVCNKHLVCKEGVLNIWGMIVLALPIEIYQIEDMNKNKSIRDFFKILGETQGRAAYQIIVHKFGSNTPFEIYQNIFLQTDLIGVGQSKLKEFDEINKIIKMEFDELIVKNGKVSIIGMYLLGISSEVLSSIFNVFFDYKIISNNVIFFTNNEKYFIVDKKKELGKYMGIDIIINSSYT